MVALSEIAVFAAVFVSGVGFGLAIAESRARSLRSRPTSRRAIQAHHDRVESLRQAQLEQHRRAHGAPNDHRAGR